MNQFYAGNGILIFLLTGEVLLMYYIYKVTNKINNKIYIGKTNNFEKRKQQHLGDNRTSKQPFKRAINKYGKENFDWEIIDQLETEKEALQKEIYYIKKFNSKLPNGYNMANDGKGASNWNLRKIVMLDLKGNFIKEFDTIIDCENETGLNHSTISACCRKKILRYKEYIFMYKEDYEKNGSTEYVKPKSSRMKKIVKYDLEGNYIEEYDSVIEASIKNNIERCNISSCLIGNIKSSCGYIWRYKGEEKPKKRVIKGVKIEQYSIDGELLNTFDNCREAERVLGLKYNSYKTILKNLDRKDKVTYGYIWKKIT